MKKKISLKIRDDYGLLLTEFADKYNLDYASLKSFISGATTGSRKGSGANKVKIKLLALGIITQEDIDKASSKQRNTKKKIDKDRKERRKVIVKIRRKFDLSAQEYFISKKDYFDKHEISTNLFRSFLAGVGTGMKKGTKAFYIRCLLEIDGLLPPVNCPEKETIENGSANC